MGNGNLYNFFMNTSRKVHNENEEDISFSSEFQTFHTLFSWTEGFELLGMEPVPFFPEFLFFLNFPLVDKQSCMSLPLIVVLYRIFLVVVLL